MREVNVLITAKVKTTVTLAEGETINNVKDRFVDIYLHGAGEHGCINKEDLGADSIVIDILEPMSYDEFCDGLGLEKYNDDGTEIGTPLDLYTYYTDLYPDGKGEWQL